MNNEEVLVLKALSEKYHLKFPNPSAYTEIDLEKGIKKRIVFQPIALGIADLSFKELLINAVVAEVSCILDQLEFEYLCIRTVCYEENKGDPSSQAKASLIIRFSPNTDLEGFERLLKKSYLNKPFGERMLVIHKCAS